MIKEWALPQGWIWTCLEDIALKEKNAIVDGPFGSNLKTSDYVETGVPVLQGKNITHNKFKWFGIRYVSDKKASELDRSSVKIGDILIVKIGSIGYSAELTELNGHDRAIIPANLAKVSVDETIVDKSFLLFWLRGLDAERHFKNVASKTAQPALSLTKIKSLPIPLPPLPVQKQIAAVLEKADTLRSQCQQMEQALNSLAQSVFLDMFGDPVSNSKNWPIKKFKDIGSSQLGKMLSEKSKQGVNPKRYLRNANVRWRKIELHDLLEMDFNEKEIKKFKLEHGDLLVCEGGDVGRCAIWRDELSDCYYQKALHRVRVNKDIVKPEYIQEYFYWMSKLGGLLSSVSEVTFSHLTAAKMAELKVPVPPIELQEGYIQKISVINESLKNIEESEAAYEQNFNSLMQRAFKGELDLKDVA